jgi:hypothetical protein
MENYYKITKAEADLLGRFEYAPNMAFDPYCSEQKDGTYIVSETMYLILKNNDKFKTVNFESKTKVNDTKVKADVKVTDIIAPK